MSELETLESSTLKGALEAMLLVSSDPVSASALAQVLEATPGEVASLLAELQVEYQEKTAAFSCAKLLAAGVSLPTPLITIK